MKIHLFVPIVLLAMSVGRLADAQTCSVTEDCDPSNLACQCQGASPRSGNTIDICGNAIQCFPSSCASQGDGSCACLDTECGPGFDSVTQTFVDCGTCPIAGQVCTSCSNGGTIGPRCSGPNAEVNFCCTPSHPTCQLGDCGAVGIGCGTQTIQCGGCPSGQECNPASAQCCTPTTCAAQGAVCGSMPDGCGQTLNCGSCSTFCESDHQCCVPTTCTAQGLTCGQAFDGCTKDISCGSCPNGQQCRITTTGPAGVQGGVCCTPKAASQVCGNRACGTVDDGCGFPLQCGTTCAAGFRCDSKSNSCVVSAPAVPASALPLLGAALLGVGFLRGRRRSR